MLSPKLKPSEPDKLESAYRYCAKLAECHPFFHVVGRGIPAERQRGLIPVFAFVSAAASSAARPDAGVALDALEDKLRLCYFDDASGPMFTALLDALDTYFIPITPFLEIIDGYRIHSSWDRFATYNELCAYLERTAEPVARLLAFMFELDVSVHRYIEEFCSGLAEAFLWEHVVIDAREGRVYLPQSDLHHFGVSPADLVEDVESPVVRDLMRAVALRTRARFDRARPLFDKIGAHHVARLEPLWSEGIARMEAILDANEPVFFASSRRAPSDPVVAIGPWAIGCAA